MRILRECGPIPGVFRLFEYEDADGCKRLATESWLKQKGVDPDAELVRVLGSGDNSVHAGRDVRRDDPKPVRSRRRRRQADGVGRATLF